MRRPTSIYSFEDLKEIHSMYKFNNELLTAEQERDLIAQYLEGRTQQIKDEALKKLVSCNLRLVLASAYRMYTYTTKPGSIYTMADLVQEGIAGLIIAISRFDLSEGVRLSTYAKWWIDNQMQRGIQRYNLPVRTPEKSKNKNPVGFSYVSLDAPLRGEDDDITLGDTLSDSIANEQSYDEDPYLTHMEKIENSILIQRALECLDEKERKYITLRFGLEGDPHTLQEMGEVFNISKEGARLMEAKILKKMARFIDGLENKRQAKNVQEETQAEIPR